VRSQENRRVEILFFDKGEEPDLVLAESDPNISEIYLPAEYKHTPVEPMLSAKPWRAEWVQPTTRIEQAGTMRVRTPGLGAGVPMTYEVRGVGLEPIGTVDALSNDGQAEANFEDWDAPADAPFAGLLEAGQPFPAAFFEFVVEGGGRRVESRNQIKYADNLLMRLEVEDGENIQVIGEEPYLLCSIWGKRKGKTTAEGVVEEKDLPPGGCSIVVRNTILVHEGVLEHGWDEEQL